jgi:hypothetical protein
MTHKGIPFVDAIGGSNQNKDEVKSSDEDDAELDLGNGSDDGSGDSDDSDNGSGDSDDFDDGSGDSDGTTTSSSVDEDEQSEDDEQLKAKWRSQKYVSGTRARFEDDLAKMKRWINTDERRRDNFLPLSVPFSDEICIQYLNFEMRRKINTKGDLLAPGTIYQVQQMLKYESTQKNHRSG